jgi:hypothetical protein
MAGHAFSFGMPLSLQGKFLSLIFAAGSEKSIPSTLTKARRLNKYFCQLLEPSKSAA